MVQRRRLTGLKLDTEATGCYENNSGRGALYKGRSQIVRTGGLYTRENVGMSSERKVRILPIESPRFPEEGSSAQG